MPDKINHSEKNEDQIVSTVSRCQLYRLFSMAFSYPDEEFLRSLTSGEFADALLNLGSQLPYSQPFADIGLVSLADETNKQDISVFYSTYFQSGNQAVSLRELAYSSLTEKALLEELFRFYQHFGLNFSHGELNELPDHLPIELEFLHYLTYMEVEALKSGKDAGNIEALQSAQRDFVSLHPGTWVQLLLARLKTVSDSTIYIVLAELLLQFITREKHFLSGSSADLIATVALTIQSHQERH